MKTTIKTALFLLMSIVCFKTYAGGGSGIVFRDHDFERISMIESQCNYLENLYHQLEKEDLSRKEYKSKQIFISLYEQDCFTSRFSLKEFSE